jgi:hypothetical protein
MSCRFILLFTVLAACGGSEPTSTTPAATTPAEKHAPAAVVPGSHEDWCAEHAVPESQCTQCNPSLAARVQGDGRLVRGARPSGVALPKVQSGPEDRAPGARALTCATST